MLPPNFTKKLRFATSVSRNRHTDSNERVHHRKSFQNAPFVRGFPNPNFTEQCFQNERFARCFRQFSHKNLRFATVSRDRHHVFSERVHPPKAKCASHYSAVHSQISQCTFRYSGVRKNVWIYRPWTDPLRAHKNVTFYYSFGRSTPRFYREGSPRANEICVSLQFWAIDTTFLLRGLPDGNRNLRFATVLGDRHHVFREGSPAENEICVSLQFWAIDTTFFVRGLIGRKWTLRFATVLGDRRRVFSERVAFRLTLPIPPGGIE